MNLQYLERRSCGSNNVRDIFDISLLGEVFFQNYEKKASKTRFHFLFVIDNQNNIKNSCLQYAQSPHQTCYLTCKPKKRFDPRTS